MKNEYTFPVRTSDLERRKLIKLCKKLGKTQSEFVRDHINNSYKIIIEGHKPEVDTEQLLQYMIQLHDKMNSINSNLQIMDQNQTILDENTKTRLVEFDKTIKNTMSNFESEMEYLILTTKFFGKQVLRVLHIVTRFFTKLLKYDDDKSKTERNAIIKEAENAASSQFKNFQDVIEADQEAIKRSLTEIKE